MYRRLKLVTYRGVESPKYRYLISDLHELLKQSEHLNINYKLQANHTLFAKLLDNAIFLDIEKS